MDALQLARGELPWRPSGSAWRLRIASARRPSRASSAACSPAWPSSSSTGGCSSAPPLT